MDTALALITSGHARAGAAHLVHALSERRLQLGRAAWSQFAREALTHPVREYIHADPFTYRAFSKPRGYAGDAVMMDYIYGLQPEELPSPANEIFAYTTSDGTATKAIRWRRAELARAIDDAASRRGRAVDVVAIACGHLREMELSVAAAKGLASVTALDVDEESLALVTSAYGTLGARACPGSVRQILSGRVRLPAADLTYSAGLYDYLTAPVATRLTTMLFDGMRPSGTLLLANFLPDIHDVGYMESFMDWHLIYRTDRDMLSLADALPPHDIAGVRQFHDPHDNITFLEITKV